MTKKSNNKFINTLNTNFHDQEEPLMLAGIDFFKMIEFNDETFSLGILKKEKLLEQISEDDFNRPHYFSKTHESLLHFLLKQDKEKLFNYLLKYKHIDYSQTEENETLVQAALHHQASYRTVHALIKNTPKEFLDPTQELPYLFAANGVSISNLSNSFNKTFQNIILEYIKKFKDELPQMKFQRRNETFDILTFAHKMWSQDGLTVLLESNLFTKEQIEKAMHAPIQDPFPEDFFLPYIIKLEKQELEKTLNQTEVEKKKFKL
jgi:hypothetical protein